MNDLGTGYFCGEGVGYKTEWWGAAQVLPLQKGGRAEKVLAMVEGGHNTFLSSFNTGT